MYAMMGLREGFPTGNYFIPPWDMWHYLEKLWLSQLGGGDATAFSGWKRILQ